EGGRLHAQIEIADAGEQEAMLTYRKTVIDAFNDAENTLVAYGRERARTQSLEHAAALDRDALGLATSRYQAGLVDFLPVLAPDRNTSQAEPALADSRTQTLVDLVGVSKARGGGWHDERPSAADTD